MERKILGKLPFLFIALGVALGITLATITSSDQSVYASDCNVCPPNPCYSDAENQGWTKTDGLSGHSHTFTADSGKLIDKVCAKYGVEPLLFETVSPPKSSYTISIDTDLSALSHASKHQIDKPEPSPTPVTPTPTDEEKEETPTPTVETPTPTVETPTPTVETPTPTMETPTPTDEEKEETPTPTLETPTPTGTITDPPKEETPTPTNTEAPKEDPTNTPQPTNTAQPTNPPQPTPEDPPAGGSGPSVISIMTLLVFSGGALAFVSYLAAKSKKA